MSQNRITLAEGLKAFFLNVCIFIPLCIYLFFYWGFWAGAAVTRWAFVPAGETVQIHGLFLIFNSFLLPLTFVLSFAALVLLFFVLGCYEFIMTTFFNRTRQPSQISTEGVIEEGRQMPWKWIIPFAVVPPLLMFLFGCLAAIFSFQPTLNVIGFYTAAGIIYGLASYIFIFIWCRIGYFHGFLAVVLETIFSA